MCGFSVLHCIGDPIAKKYIISYSWHKNKSILGDVTRMWTGIIVCSSVWSV